MKKSYFFIPFFLFFVAVSAQAQAQTNPIFKFLGESNGKIQIEFNLPAYSTQLVNTTKGLATKINADKSGYELTFGEPDLPYFASSIIINDTKNSTIIAQVVESELLVNQLIVPSKGNIIRTENPANLPYSFGASYEVDAFLPKKQVVLSNPYIFRDFRGQTIRFNPFQYNPVTHELKVVKKALLEIKTNQGNATVNPLFRTSNAKITRDYLPLYNHHFLNSGTKIYVPISEAGDLLIICNDAFMPAMQPFVNWKIRKGINTRMVGISTIGNTTSSIQAYITNQYLSNNLGSVIFVGDIAQIDSPIYAGGKSDPSYGMISGTDSYPEVIIGRISAESIADVNTQVTRILNYEITPTISDLYSKFIGIASQEGPGDDNELDYEHIRNIKNKLRNYHYTSDLEFYEGTQGGNDLDGYPTANQVKDGINPGTGLICYTGHGSSTSWGTSGFNNGNINTLTNSTCLPIIWSVACVNGEFDSGTCFAERWMRATNNGQPIGAVGTFMSSINQSWNPPMRGQDEMVDILSDNYATNNTKTFGGLSVNGCLNMNDVYGTAGDDMTRTWHIFGDPTMVIRTKSPMVLSATHAATIFIGATSFSVSSPVEGALVCISMNNQILAKAYIQNGVANLNFLPLNNVGTAKITLTAFNHTPYLIDIPAIAGSDPFLSVVNWIANEPNGVPVNVIEAGQTVDLTISLQNIGNQNTNNVIATLTSPSLAIVVNNGTCDVGAINISQEVSLDCFSITIVDGAADQTVVNLLVTLTDDAGNTWNATLPVTINSPKLSISAYWLSDAGGNNNVRLDIGESATLYFWQKNIGHAATAIGYGLLTLNGNQITQLSGGDPNYIQLAIGDSALTSIAIIPSSNAVNGSWNSLQYTSSAGLYVALQPFMLKIGGVIDLAESAQFKYSTSNSDVPWSIDNQIKYQGNSSYKSGTITDSQFSVMDINFTSSADDSISFYLKTSSELDWDFLHFYIDNLEVSRWSGDQNWTRVSFFVPAGLHNVKWEYAKDEVVSAGEDAVWIDYVDFPATANFSTVSLENIQTKELMVYPNPAKDILNIVVSETQSIQSIQLINLLGQSTSFSLISGVNNTIQMDTKHLANGIYFLHLMEQNTMKTAKIIISK